MFFPRPALKGMQSPFLVRSKLEGRAITPQMADDLRILHTRTGYVTEEDLELLGWTAAQIAAHRTAARRRAMELDVR